MTATLASQTIVPQSDVAVAFLQRYSAGDLIVVVEIFPDEVPTAATFRADESHRIHEYIKRHQGTHNQYFSVNPVSEPIRKKPTKNDIVGLKCVHVDIDLRDGQPREDERERIRQLIAHLRPRPTFVIDSGNGFQVFWVLDDLIPSKGQPERLERLNYRMGALLGGDKATHNLDRIMRIPGTINVPTEVKLKRGYVPVVASLVSYDGGTVTPSDFPVLPDRLFKLLRKDDGLRSRWCGDPTGLEDTSASAFDMSIVAKLKARRFSVDEVESILTHFAFGQGEKANVERMYERATGIGATRSYEATSSGIIWYKQTREGFAPIRLSNFTAQIVTEIIEDDGAETQQAFEIRAGINGDWTSFTVPARQFPIMNWVVDCMGARAVVEAGYGTKDRLRCAIQTLSDEVVQRHTYTHTGWRRIDGQWVYLHGGGGIGARGLVEGVDVIPPEPLTPFVLPAPPSPKELSRALLAEFAFLDLAPDHITVPLLAAAYTVVLHQTDFGIHLAGPTGTFKTELAALVQQHFGSDFEARRLPAAWSSTGNALEGLAFLAKDAVLVIDDFAPGSNIYAQRHLDATADRVFRSQGNRSGRARMSADASLRVTRFPRGLTLSTGEDTPKGQSLRARIVLLTLSPHTVNAERLSTVQQTPQQRALAMSGFLQWLAPTLDDRRSTHAAAVAKHRSRIREAHLRTPDIMAQLYVGWCTFVQFCTDAGTLDSNQAAKLRGRGWKALVACARHQTEHIAQSEPTRRFLDLVSAAIGSGAAHLADLSGNQPTEFDRWGWRVIDSGESSSLRPLGDRIGWVDGEDVYLVADAAYRVANRLAGEDQIVLTVSMLKKHLYDRGMLKRIEKERRQTRYEVRITAAGARPRVLHLDAETVRPRGAEDPNPATM